MVVILSVYFIYSKEGSNDLKTLTVKRGEFLQTVTVSGKVIPAQNVELSFNRSGKIVSVSTSVGQHVFAGQTIASLDSKEAALSLETARLGLKKLLENSPISNETGLSQDDEESLQNVNQTFADIETISNELDTLLNNYQTSTYKLNLPNDIAGDYFDAAQASYNAAIAVYEKASTDYEPQKNLTKKEVIDLTENTYLVAKKVSQALKDTDNFVSYIYNQYSIGDRPAEVTTDKTSVSSWRVTIDADVSDLSANRKALKDSNLDIEAQRLLVSQREHEYNEHFLFAPFSGTITQLEAKVGENAISGQMLASIDNDALFQVESYVPEINIANIKVGNQAEITLDAYGDSPFEARVISIDPAETIKDGVSTYKIKLQFLERDTRIKSGMTANIILTTEKKNDIIAIPAGAITAEGEQKTVQVKEGEQIIKKVITTGSISALGQTEIISGLNEGDEVIISLPKD